MQGCSSDRVTSLATSLTPVLQLLQEQADRISRLEEIVAAQPDIPPEAERAANVVAALQAQEDSRRGDAERLERTRRHVSKLQDACAALEAQQVVLTSQGKQQQAAVAATAQRVADLEAQLLGSTAATPTSGWHVQVLDQERGAGGCGLAGSGPGGIGSGSSSSSVVERLSRVEELLTRSNENAVRRDEDQAVTAGKLRRLEARVAEQLASARNDCMQATAAACAEVQRDARKSAAARLRDAEAAWAERLEVLSAKLEASVASVSRSAGRQGAELSDELDRRTTQVYEGLDRRLQELQAQLDSLARSKADAASLGACATQMSEAFEEATATLSEASAAASEALQEQVALLRAEVGALAARKADSADLEDARRRLQQRCDACSDQTAEAARKLAELERQVAAAAKAQAVEGLRLDLSEVGGGVEALRATARGLHAASAAAAGALERHGRALESLNSRCSSATRQIDALRSEVLSDAPADGTAGAAVAAAGAPLSLAARVARAEALWRQLAAQIGSKADDAALQAVLVRLEELQDQVASNSEGVSSLTSATYKRVDEHATAIQRLAEAISSGAQERPTAVAVRQMLSESLTEAEVAWQAEARDLLGKQRGAAAQLQELSGQVRATSDRAERTEELVSELRSSLTAEQQRVCEALQKTRAKQELLSAQVAKGVARTLGGGVREEVAEVVREQVADQLKLQCSELSGRVAAAEGRLRALGSQQAAAGREAAVQAGLLEKHSSLMSTLERSIEEAATSCATAIKKLTGRMEATRNVAAERHESMELLVERQHSTLAALAEGLCGSGGGTAVADGGRGRLDVITVAVVRKSVASAALAAARRVVEERVGAAMRERAVEEDTKWKSWLEKFAGALEQCVTRDELQHKLDSACRQVAAAAESSAARAAGAAADAAAAGLRPLERRVERLEAAGDSAAAAAKQGQQASSRELAAVLEAMASKADSDDVARMAAHLHQLLADKADRREVQEVVGALGAKLDVSTFLAASAARARALEARSAALAAGVGSGGGSSAAED